MVKDIKSKSKYRYSCRVIGRLNEEGGKVEGQKLT